MSHAAREILDVSCNVKLDWCQLVHGLNRLLCFELQQRFLRCGRRRDWSGCTTIGGSHVSVTTELTMIVIAPSKNGAVLLKARVRVGYSEGQDYL